jgi:hypothetical protein
MVLALVSQIVIPSATRSQPGFRMFHKVEPAGVGITDRDTIRNPLPVWILRAIQAELTGVGITICDTICKLRFTGTNWSNIQVWMDQ